MKLLALNSPLGSEFDFYNLFLLNPFMGPRMGQNIAGPIMASGSGL